MKKTVTIVAVLLIVLSSYMNIWADAGPKDIEVILSEIPTVLKVGESVEIKALAPKHGSVYIDRWENASKTTTELDLVTETIISKAVFTAEKPGINTIRYTICMTSGKSDTTFCKTVERTIEVINPIEVAGAVIKDLQVVPVYNDAGAITLYKASGAVHALWSDGTTTPNGSVYFFFGPNEASKNINVTLYMDDVQYNYTVTVNR